MFSYLGGKKFQAKWIASHFIKHYTYVEPFGGAFWVYFNSTINSEKNVYNDYNRYIANIFYCAVNKRALFLQKLNQYRPQVETLFKKFKDELVPLDYDVELGDVEMAAKYIYLQTQTFSGMIIDEKTSYVDLKGKYKSKYEHFIDKLNNTKYIQKLNNITNVENESYEKVIKEYDSKYALFYVDPPYFNMEDYYTKEFGKEEHLKLANILKSIKGKFVLSYYDFPQLKKWFPIDKYHWETKEFNKQNANVDGAGKGEEILIMNFKPALTLG
jgi:DNA adenine methylase